MCFHCGHLCLKQKCESVLSAINHLLTERCQCQRERIKCPMPVPSPHLVCLARTARMDKSTFQCLTVNNDPYTLKVVKNTDVNSLKSQVRLNRLKYLLKSMFFLAFCLFGACFRTLALRVVTDNFASKMCFL